MKSLLLTGILALTPSTSADCTRAFLTNATTAYVAAQTTGKPSTLAALLSPHLNYTESDKTVDIATGVLTKAMTIDHALSLHDPARCATFTELIVTNPAGPYVIGTRMVFDPTELKATLIETIATKPGDWAFNATGYLHWTSLESWPPIPLAQQLPAWALQSAADAYFTRFNTPSLEPPFSTPCARLEGGAYTDARATGANTCGLGLPSNLTVVNRRYVVDEEMGAVTIFLGFPGLDREVRGKPMADAHTFRVERGGIRYIHTVTTCEHAGCGMNGTTGVEMPGN